MSYKRNFVINVQVSPFARLYRVVASLKMHSTDIKEINNDKVIINYNFDPEIIREVYREMQELDASGYSTDKTERMTIKKLK